jgi:hypothetical protein
VNKKILEAKVEREFKNGIRELGGKCYKFVSPGNAGMPDRLVTFKPSILFFVELKAPGEELRPLQKLRKKELEDDGFLVFSLTSLEEVKVFLTDTIWKYFNIDRVP